MDQKMTLQAVLDDYLTRKNLKPRTIDNYRMVANAYLKDWLQRPLIEISKDEIEIRFNQISKRQIGLGKGGPGAANNTMRVLRAFYKFAADMYEMPDGSPIVKSNPVRRLNQLNLWHRLRRRQTLLSESDLPLWYEAICDLKEPVIRDYVLFVLLTGLRKNEAAHLRWNDVYFDRGYFEILDTKNKYEFALPITKRLKGIFEHRAANRADRNNPYVFAGFGETGRLNLRNAHFNDVYERTGIRFGLHDLRRTYLTQGYLMGQDLETLKNLANHKSGFSRDVTKGYLIVRVSDLLEPMEQVGDRLWSMMKGDSTCGSHLTLRRR